MYQLTSMPMYMYTCTCTGCVGRVGIAIKIFNPRTSRLVCCVLYNVCLGGMFGLLRLGFWVSFFSFYCFLASVLYTCFPLHTQWWTCTLDVHAHVHVHCIYVPGSDTKPIHLFSTPFTAAVLPQWEHYTCGCRRAVWAGPRRGWCCTHWPGECLRSPQGTAQLQEWGCRWGCHSI